MLSSKPTPGVDNDERNQTAGKARVAAASIGEMASQAASAVGEMAGHAACELGKEADNLSVRAGVGIQELADRLSKCTPQTGVLGNASQAVAQTVKDGGEYLQGAKFSGVTEDIAQLIRRNPIPAVFIAIGLGWFVGRKLGR